VNFQKDNSSIEEILPLMYLLPYLFVAVLRELDIKEDEENFTGKSSFTVSTDV